MQNLLIITNGLTATGKSTTAKRLSEQFGLSLYQTCLIRVQKFGMGAVMSEGKRTWVYSRMLKLASNNLEHRNGIMLDGSFYRGALRQAAYNWAAKHSYMVAIVKCICPNEALIYERVKRRRLKISPAAEADSMRVYYYWKKQSDSPSNDLLSDGMAPAIVTYNTENNTVSLSGRYQPEAAVIAAFLADAC
jgi:predicted kinase